jgi:hypothetical protein
MSADITEDSVRVALGDLLQANWDPTNSQGYDATDDESVTKRINVTLGTYSEDSPVPTMALRDVSEIAEGGAGYSSIKATGDGPIQTFRGRIDLLTYVGATEDLPENTQLVAKRIGFEAQSIIHDNAVGVMDPVTGELLATSLACSRPRVTPDPDLPGPQFVGRQEVTYEINEDPPDR